MKTMAAGLFKAHCLAVMDEVQAKRVTVVITKHGKPVAKLVPAGYDTADIYHFLYGKGAVIGDVISPALEDWGNLWLSPWRARHSSRTGQTRSASPTAHAQWTRAPHSHALPPAGSRSAPSRRAP